MLDWSAVFLTQIRGLDPAWARFGYAAFATTMTIGRLTGDRIVHALGPVRIAVFGSLLAASGLALATFVPHAAAGLAGFALVGAGCSNIVPVLYSAVGRQRTMPEHIAVPAISTLRLCRHSRGSGRDRRRCQGDDPADRAPVHRRAPARRHRKRAHPPQVSLMPRRKPC